MAQKPSRRAKYSREVEEIRRLQDLNKILKAGDMENALLSNSAKDTETMPDSVVDQLLANADASEHGTEKGLEYIQRFATSAGGARVTGERRVKIKRKGGKVAVKRTLHLKKSSAKKRKR